MITFLIIPVAMSQIHQISVTQTKHFSLYSYDSLELCTMSEGKPKRRGEEINEEESSPPPRHDDAHAHDTKTASTGEHHNVKTQNEEKSAAETANDNNTMESEEASFAKLMSIARPEWPMLFLAFLLMIATEVGSLYNPLLLADAYDYLVDETTTAEERMSHINRIMMLVLFIHLAGMVTTFFRTTIMGMAGERVVARLRNRLYANILIQEMSFFDQHKTGELVSRLGSDTTLLQQATSTALPEVVLGIIQVCVCIALMFWISSTLAGLTLGMVVIIFLVCLPLGTVMGRLSKLYQDTLGQAQTHSTEALGAMRTVQSFAAEEREGLRYRRLIGDPDAFPWWWPTKPPKTSKDAATTTYRAGVLNSMTISGFYGFIFGAGFAAMYVSLWYGFKLVNNGSITLGDLTAFQSYIFTIGAGLGSSARSMSIFIQGQGASGRIFYLLNRIPAIPTPFHERTINQADKISDKEKDDHENDETDCEVAASTFVSQVPPRTPESMIGAIDFKNVHFSYPTRPDVPVLVDFSLCIPPNTTAALVGTSGAGKSTVVALMQRFYDVTGGSICIDGHDVRNLNLSWLRTHMGYVQQEPQLFGLTVRENVTYGVSRNVDNEELFAVCRKANAHDFIMSWPKQYDTLVGERGIQLSGGQKQRLAIARALLVDPRVLLLDEATSALDAESEHLVQEAIEKAVVGRTVLIVAHRLSTIRRASQIVVLDSHRIVDVGDHVSLLQRCSKYQELIKRQELVQSTPSLLLSPAEIKELE